MVYKNKNNNIVLTKNSVKDSYGLMNLVEPHKIILAMLDGKHSKDQILEYINCHGNDFSENEYDEFLEILEDVNVLEDVHDNILTEAELERFSRQLLLFGDIKNNSFEDAQKFQKKLKQSHVVLLGLGGTGSYTFYGLAAMGVGEITLVDYDRVELSNLTRQILYTEEDIGKLKTEVVKAKCEKINSEIKYNIYNEKIEDVRSLQRIIKGSNFVISQIDYPRFKIKAIVNEACYLEGIPYLCSSGTIGDSGVCGPIIVPGETACYECFAGDNRPIIDEEFMYQVNSRIKTSIIDPYNAIIANCAVLETVKYLTGFSETQLINRYFTINYDNYEIKFYDVAKDPECRVCGEKKNV